jgi:hypothetical protein
VAAPVAALCWRPVADPDPDRWSYFQAGLVVAYLQVGDLDAAIDVLDDARAAYPRSAASAMLRASGGVHDLLKAAVARRWAATPERPDTVLARARAARVVPEIHAQAGTLLDEAERAQPDSPAVWRERGGWWLGRHDDPADRRRAADAYRRAAGDPSARVTLALLTSDPKPLEIPTAVRPERVRIARALIAARRSQQERPRSVPKP